MKVYLFVLMAMALLLAACNGTGQLSDASPQAAETVTDYRSLIIRLEAEGATVEEKEELNQPFLSVSGRIIAVDGEDVQVFEYADTQATQQDASHIEPDGSSTTTTMISWMATPHFYRAERLIVLYVGDNTAVIELLNTVLGEQFAGG